MQNAAGHYGIQIDYADTRTGGLVQKYIIELGIVVHRAGGKIGIADEGGEGLIFLGKGNEIGHLGGTLAGVCIH